MKRIRIIIRIITIALIVLTLTGVIILLINQNLDLLDTAYEIIAFSVGMAGMIMAVVSQIDSYNQEKTNHKMIEELRELNRDADADEKVDHAFQKKLDTLIDQNDKIYSSLHPTVKTTKKNKK